MKEEIIILKSTITIKVDERVNQCENIKEALKLGCFKYVTADVSLSTESGIVCDDEDVLDQVKQAIIYGFEEKG